MNIFTDLRFPVSVNLVLTHQCNFQCVHCLLGNMRNSLSKELSFDEWRKTIDELYENGLLSVGVTGGEPFLREDIEKILNYLTSKDLEIHFNTNGSLITKELAKKLADFSFSHFDLTVHAYDPKVFKRFCQTNLIWLKKTIEGINFLIKYNVDFIISRTLTKINLEDTFVMIDKLSELGAKKFGLTPVHSCGHAQSKFDELFIDYTYYPKVIDKIREKFSKNKIEVSMIIPYDFSDIKLSHYKKISKKTSIFGCNAGTAKLTVWANGWVTPCSFLQDPFFYLGNVKKEKIEKIWKSKKRIRFINRREKISDEACQKCKFFMICQGGCMTEAFFLTNDIYKGDPNCPFRRIIKL